MAGVHYQLWSVPSYAGGSPEYVDGSNIKSAKRPVVPGDILLCKINPRINRVWRVSGGSKEGQQVASPEWVVLRLPESVRSITGKYLQYYLSSPRFRQWITSAVSGVTGSHTRAKSKEILSQPVPVPPLAEQQRIVEALEEQLSRLGNAQGLVRRVRRLSTELAGRYAVDRLDDLVRRESLTRPLGDVVVSSQGGWSRAQRHLVDEEAGVPYLKMNNITSVGGLDLEQVAYVHADAEEAEKYSLKMGEVLFNSKNSAELVGKSAVVDERILGWVFNENITRIRFDASIVPEFAVLQLNSPRFRYASRSKASTNVAAVYMKDLKRVPFIVPPVGEQLQIVERYRSLCEESGAAKRYVESAEGQAVLLHRRLLSAAVNGQLVAHDDADEPASLLLERIYSEHQGSKGGKTGRPQERKDPAPQEPSEPNDFTATAFVPAQMPASIQAVQQEFDL
ncbi:restriction endonuclease subunit S [Streptomyces pseudovenezuelae]|uniref:restriction endonuclease subunit S n=1 Tax=Streptomyces pseudovenezuelae TaxID=67350 RepID=UPI002E815B7C|nr:restriction endonuclease subunit S [Streptomyces pseudovenezuelae]